VPSVVCIGLKDGVLGLEWIDGSTVREVLGGGVEGETDDDNLDDADTSDEGPLLEKLGLSEGMSLTHPSFGARLSKLLTAVQKQTSYSN
jgi:hypothetical protein